MSQELRKKPTTAETLLWEALRNHGFANLKFRRQHPVKWFIADFYCHEARLVIEVDGGIHNNSDQAEYDQNRTAELEELGIQVIRFSTLQRSSSPSPGGEGAGG
jgi:very-short-patch-repair endonuclease